MRHTNGNLNGTGRAWRSRACAAVVVTLVVATLAGCGSPPAPHPSSPIEFAYYQRGPYDVVHDFVSDELGNPYTIVRPATLDEGAPHPIIAWANGSEWFLTLQPEQTIFCVTERRPAPQYCSSVFNMNFAVLDHLASWGYVVAASESGFTGPGTHVWNATRDLIRRNSDPSSPYSGKLDPTRVGATGHSQGAAGALNAARLSHGVISSVATLELIEHSRTGASGWPVVTSEIDASVFMISVAGDVVVAPESSNVDWFNRFSGPTVKAQLNWRSNPLDDHLTSTRKPFPELGYLTAWFQYQLRGDKVARSAFVGDPAEIDANPRWINVAAKNLT